MAGTGGSYDFRYHGIVSSSNNAGAGTYDLDVVGSTLLDMACVTINNPSDRLMVGWVYGEINAPRIRRVGSGEVLLTLELSLDGGVTWINWSFMHLTRTSDPALETVESNSFDRVAASLSIPPGDTVTVCIRTTIDVTAAYTASSNMNVANGLRVIAGTEMPQ